MNIRIQPIIFIVSVLSLFVSNTLAIICHVCNSHYDGPDCASSEKIKDGKFLADCSSLEDGDKYIYCRKMEQELLTNGGLEMRIVRQCGYYNVSSHGCNKAGLIDGGRQFTCTCDEDGCNSSSSLRPALLASVLLALIAALF